MERSCIRFSKISADDAIKKYRALGLLDTTYHIEQDENYVYIPLIRHIDGSITHDFKPREDAFTVIGKKPGRKGLKNTGASYIRLGNSIIFKSSISQKVAHEYASRLKVDNVYVETGKIQGIKREPSLKLIYGNGGETVVRESEVSYIMDLQKVMFSPGNINTRSKMKFIDFTGMIILDMFCGIGYFSLQILKNSRPARMVMCDINPDSIHYLKKNLQVNRIKSKVDIYTGDSRAVLPAMQADYIIMGNFNSINFMVAALLRSRIGTQISMHYLTPTESMNSTQDVIIDIARKLGYVIECIENTKVKSVGPHYQHMNTIFNVTRIL
ncbi:class I SAM-dependent methyltransferase [Ferroplasma acidiphilum]|uniref:Met-10+ protein n=2 Tax=Ferroplasma TaxID=74968 RepID=S0AQC1_FERAC|nr:MULTISPECIES: methyltransferase [Ferroplasma]AGO61146.1 Met-10+ protein [Ferroplasma acidarmanus Fer1]NOL60361.1 methyltransferase [Ferroplasma acidiphilum]